jgi:hypothetical protein
VDDPSSGAGSDGVSSVDGFTNEEDLTGQVDVVGASGCTRFDHIEAMSLSVRPDGINDHSC